MIKHFVTFLSPGTFVAEKTTKEIDSWDVDRAVEMAREVVERYDAKPYGFYFSTRELTDGDWDHKETAKSGTYFLGGTIYTREEVEQRNDPDERVLRANMECNGIDKIIVNTNSWKTVLAFTDSDTLLEVTL